MYSNRATDSNRMTVRAWVTISVLALAALAAAFVVRVVSPIPAPEIVASVGGDRLPGRADASCWPQRGDRLRCREGDGGDPGRTVIARSGSLRVFVNFPVQPDSGTLEVRDAEDAVVLKEAWRPRLRYALEPGRYELTADARYPRKAFLRWRFGFRIP